MKPLERGRKIARLAFHQLERARAFADRAVRRARLRLGGAGALEREAAHWSRRRPGQILGWQDHPVIQAHINTRVSGDADVNWLGFFARDFGGQGLDRALNIGCGEGDLEEHAFSLGLVRRFHSIDISAGAVERARERLRQYQVELEIADANQVRLEPESFDATFAASSLHHLVELEHLLDQVRESLKPGGLFVFDEFVGPSRFQWPEHQLLLVNELLAYLAPRYRRNLRGRGQKRRVYRAPLDETSRDSPFEAARSQEILPLVRERFEILVQRDYGGAILHPLLDGIAGNFQPGREEDDSLLKKLAGLEQELERAGRIGSDFTVVVAQKRGRR